MAADDPLTKLAQELTSNEGYLTGRRSFPRTVTLDQAADLADRVHGEIDKGAAARAESARRRQIPIACHAGCTGCCEELVMVYSPEALAVARWLRRPENAQARADFLAAYPRWRERAGDGPDRLSDTHASGDEQAHLRAHIEQWRKRVLCAFNHGGMCSIYPVRPILCRNAHATDTPEHCYGDDPSGIQASRLDFKPLDDYVLRSRGLMRAAHHAIGGPRQRPTALCEAVYGLVKED